MVESKLLVNPYMLLFRSLAAWSLTVVKPARFNLLFVRSVVKELLSCSQGCIVHHKKYFVLGASTGILYDGS